MSISGPESSRESPADAEPVAPEVIRPPDDPLFVYDANGVCRWVNQFGEALLGLDAGRIVGRTASELFTGRSGVQTTAWRRSVETKESSHFVSRTTVAGQKSQIQTSIFPVMDSAGDVQSIVCVERRLPTSDVIREELLVLEAESAPIAEIAGTLSSSLNIEDVYERFASEVKTLVGFDRISAIVVNEESQTLDRLYSAGLDPDSLRPWRHWSLENTGIQWVARRRESVIERDLSDPQARRFIDNETLFESGFRSGIRVPMVVNDKVIGIIALWSLEVDSYGPREQRILERLAEQIAPAVENARIHSETQRRLETLRSTQEQLVRVERLRAMGELASGVAHDFNNALTAILGRTQLLIDQTTDDAALKSLRVIEQSAQDSAQLVMRILEFARVDSVAEPTPVDLDQLMADVVELTRHKWSDEAQSKGQNIQVRIRRGRVPMALGNYSELREVLANIIINAYQAITGDGLIEISAESSQGKVHVSVSDNGSGMTPEVSKRIFDPFFTTNLETGTGLGLSVAFGIISRHNGTIDVDTEEGAGTTMRISLPMATTGPGAGKTEVPASETPTGPAHILVIEDEPLILDIMARILGTQGHTVALAPNGEEGISLFEKGRYDMVFTDLGMPGMSGWDVARAIKDHNSEVPVIMITGWGAAIDPADVLNKGVDGIVAKPFNVQGLLDVVQKFL